MMQAHRSARMRLAAFAASAMMCAARADGAVASNMTTPPGASAIVHVTLSVTTSFGTSSDDDTKVVAVAGTNTSALSPDAPPFAAVQSNALQLDLADTTFTFNLFCIPIFGCQTLHVTVNDLSFTQALAACSPINPTTGAVAFTGMQMLTTGTYSTSGLATSSGDLDAVGNVDFNGRITNPTPGVVRFDQLTLADQTFTVPKDQLPSGVTAMSLTVQTNLANTTLSGPLAPSKDDFDADDDGVFNACDACTDTDGDGFGDDAFPWNTCAADNCPGVPNPSQIDLDNDGIGQACECPADISPAGSDNAVDVNDLLAVVGMWGATGPPGFAPADVNRDGVVNVNDLLAVVGAWGACP